MSQCRLIINGDDFGASEEVNEAVIRAFQDGCLTSCSLMVTGKAFEDAVRRAKENRGLAVGIHLVVVMGRSVLPHEQIPCLVDQHGNFPDDPTAAGLRYYFSKSARAQLGKELAAQFARFASTGLACSHVDSHLHMHVHPVVLQAAMLLAEHYGVKRMRVPWDDLGIALRFDRGQALLKTLHAAVFALLTRRMRKILAARRFAFPDRVYGHFQSGRMTEEYVLFLLDHLGAASSEIYFHPALHRPEDFCSPGKAQAMDELSILLSGKVAQRIAHRGIRLIQYADLKTCLRRP